ncbi:hypothetical protein QZH41_002808 [Actinostola sp. cb2023]|nr:hypothetical protein QZH41_002808 [Actinostola sp. cb2023]
MVGFGGMMRGIQNKVVHATQEAVEAGKQAVGNVGAQVARDVLNEGRDFKDAFPIKGLDVRDAPLRLQPSRKRNHEDARNNPIPLTYSIDDVLGGAGRKRSGGMESAGRVIPVKKAQLGDLFSPLPTEISVKDGYWQDYYPTQATFSPCHFFIPQSTDFIDMGMCQLTLGVKLIQTDGTDMAAGLNVGVVNNVGHSLIKRFDVKLNDTSVGEPTDLYHYKAYDSNLRNFTPDQKDNYLQIEGWYTDEATDAKMNNFTTGTANTPILATAANYNKGYDERTRLFYSNYTIDGTQNAGVPPAQAGREVFFTIQPAVDVFQSGRYLVPGVSIVIQIDFNDPQFVLMAAAGSTARFKITSVIFPKPIRRTMEQGKSVFSFTDLFQQSVPDQLTIGFVKSTAFNGVYNENPFNFKLFGLKDLRLVVNGTERPVNRIEFKSHDGVEGYEMMFSSSGNMHRGFSNGIKRKDYAHGNALLCLNLTPDGKDAKNYTYKKNEGTLDLFLNFKEPLTENLTVLFLPEFENEVLVDPNKVVLMSKNY